MPDLSPAAQAINLAAIDAFCDGAADSNVIAAAALRAAADQMTGIIASASPRPSRYVEGVEDSIAFLEAIATEMEGER
jgi:hypothetical protein